MPRSAGVVLASDLVVAAERSGSLGPLALLGSALRLFRLVSARDSSTQLGAGAPHRPASTTTPSRPARRLRSARPAAAPPSRSCGWSCRRPRPGPTGPNCCCAVITTVSRARRSPRRTPRSPRSREFPAARWRRWWPTFTSLASPSAETTGPEGGRPVQWKTQGVPDAARDGLYVDAASGPGGLFHQTVVFPGCPVQAGGMRPRRRLDHREACLVIGRDADAGGDGVRPDHHEGLAQQLDKPGPGARVQGAVKWAAEADLRCRRDASAQLQDFPAQPPVAQPLL